MAESARVYPGLDVTWPDAPLVDTAEVSDRVLAELDEFGPVAAEPVPSGLRVFFGSMEDRDVAAAHIRAALAYRAEAVDVPDEHWAERSQASLTAVTVGRLTVAPPWDVPADHTGVIVIQPSMGFGTGHHASTRLCLRLLQEAPVAGARALDVGTGSGVLAIAARMLGAESVVAVDFDADAVTSARECAELNNLSGEIDIRQSDIEREPEVDGEPFTLILANLTGGMLVRMAGRLLQLARPGAVLIVSGVTRDEEEAVTRAFADLGAQVTARLAEEEWVGLQVLGSTSFKIGG
ncbi:MAG: methyltransferase domain-containing protein [Acidobacteria bacterium]|nr:methyltransferase domain-containing protein [Acidobacteriota bacterium]